MQKRKEKKDKIFSEGGGGFFNLNPREHSQFYFFLFIDCEKASQSDSKAMLSAEFDSKTA